MILSLSRAKKIKRRKRFTIICNLSSDWFVFHSIEALTSDTVSSQFTNICVSKRINMYVLIV